jgi:hypothetical protein
MAGPNRHNGGKMGLEYLVIVFFFGLATAIIGKSKGSSFWIWFLVGAVLPILGLIAVVLYRREKDEPERQCPNCLKAVKLYVQVCPRCGTELYLPDPRAVRHPGVRSSPYRLRQSANAPAGVSAARCGRSRWRSRGRSASPRASSSARGGAVRP